MMPAPFELSCAYLNERRVAELCDPRDVRRALASLDDIAARPDLFDDHAVLRLIAYKGLLRDWLLRHPNSVRPLDEYLLKGASAVGKYVLLHHNFYGKGIAPPRRGTHAPEIHTAVVVGSSSLTLRAPLTPKYIAPGSAALRLRSRAALTAIGFVEHDQNGELLLRLLFAGDIVPVDDLTAYIAGPDYWWGEHEIKIEDIDSFSRVRGVRRPGAVGLKALAAIPEKDVKAALCEILGEPDVPKDWGGEQADLFTSFLMVQGRRVSAAFLLKGPAKYSPMTFAHLGKNGDQIVRMFDLPASVFVLQHCHRVTPAIRTTMQRFAVGPGSPSRYCVIDGEDTFRLLAAYGKCGLECPRGADLFGAPDAPEE